MVLRNHSRIFTSQFRVQCAERLQVPCGAVQFRGTFFKLAFLVLPPFADDVKLHFLKREYVWRNRTYRYPAPGYRCLANSYLQLYLDLHVQRLWCSRNAASLPPHPSLPPPSSPAQIVGRSCSTLNKKKGIRLQLHNGCRIKGSFVYFKEECLLP